MQTSEIKITKITATENKWIAPVKNNPYEPTFAREVYLGEGDSPENWIEVTDEQKTTAENLAKELNRARLEQHLNAEQIEPVN